MSARAIGRIDFGRVFGAIPDRPLADDRLDRDEGRESFVDTRFVRLIALLRSAPDTRVSPIWSEAPSPTVAEELVAWTTATEMDPEAVLARAIVSAVDRERLMARFCEARAQREFDLLTEADQ